jgi:ribose-phosphate pyrophosphokinase
MDEKVVIAGPASQALAVKVAELLQAKTFSCETKTFPDGENYLRIELDDEAQLKGKDVIIIQTTSSNDLGNQNHRIMELIMMISAVKRIGAAKIRVVVPYLAYGRQHLVFRPGESAFIIEILKWIVAAGATEFYCIDVHDPSVLEALPIPVHNLDPMFTIAKEFKKFNIMNPVVVCPDKGAYERSRIFASALGNDVPIEHFNKRRDVKTGQINMDGKMHVQGKDVIIADDIIATGGTMASAIAIAKKSGAKSIYAIGTHSLLLKNAVYTLLKAGTNKILGTDTLDTSVYQVSMANIIAEAIEKNP